MNPFASSSRSNTVREYAPLEKIKDARLDHLVGQHNEHTIQVSKKTFNMMKKAHQAMMNTGYNTFPDGPANQKTHVIASQGRSWARLLNSRIESVQQQSNNIPNEVKVIKKHGGGNCDEYSMLFNQEMRIKSRSLPVFSVKEKHAHEDHLFNIIGDWRDRTTGDHAIVADAWQGIKKVHTYGERSNTETPSIVDHVPPGMAMVSLYPLSQALKTRVMPDNEVNMCFQQYLGSYEPGEFTEKVLNRLANNNSLWDSVMSTQNPYVSYQDPEGRKASFNDAPVDYIKSYLNAR